jgi:formylglycine-generating enzyme required for sulfatase activity
MNKFHSVAIILLAVTAGGCGPKTSNPGHASPAKAEPEEIILAKDLGLRMIPLEPGKFLMGSPADEPGRSEDETLHEVTIEVGFSLGATEVTQDQYKKLTGTNPSEFRDEYRPVENVSWDDAAAFCRKLTENERAAGNLPEGMAYRLPTEAEWEYACRAGGSKAYSHGDDEATLAEHAWHRGNSGNTSHPVGARKPNALGFHDMHGNVWEWCRDPYGDYGDDSEKNGSMRVRRGGSWNERAHNCRSAKRLWWLPSRRFNDLGFRIALGRALE